MTIRAVLHRLRYAGAEDLPEYDIQRSVCVGVNLMCISIIFLNATSGTLFYLLSRDPAVLAGAFTEIGFVLGVIALNARRRYELANACFYTIIVAATFYFSAILGKSSEAQLMILFILGLIYFLFRKTRTRIFCIAITLLLLVALEANFLYHFIPAAPLKPDIAQAVRYLVYAVVISLVLLIFYLYNKNTRMIIQLYSYSKSIDASLRSEERLNELKNQFFQSISHDIRGAFFGVSGVCLYIKKQIDKGAAISPEAAKQLMDASNHYEYILNHFLEVSKFKDATIDQLNLEVFDLKAEIGKIIDIHKYLANQKNITIRMAYPAGFPKHIVGDKLKTTRIVYNLLTNALKFTPIGSTVHLSIERCERPERPEKSERPERPERPEKSEKSEKSETWRLSVRDEGSGIPPAKLKKLFQPFETEISAQNPDGVGLGLYITKYIAGLLDATISVHNAPGGGACFVVEFPLIKQLVTT